jgi:hypothetical protein
VMNSLSLLSLPWVRSTLCLTRKLPNNQYIACFLKKKMLKENNILFFNLISISFFY